MKSGRLPLVQFAYKVNWDIRRMLPPTSNNDLLSLPLTSAKIRSSVHLVAASSIFSCVSEAQKPTNINKPESISPVICFSTRQVALLTR